MSERRDTYFERNARRRPSTSFTWRIFSATVSTSPMTIRIVRCQSDVYYLSFSDKQFRGTVGQPHVGNGPYSLVYLVTPQSRVGSNSSIGLPSGSSI